MSRVKEWIKKYPAISLIVGIILAATLGSLIWVYGTRAWNGVGNKIFEWKIGKKQEQVNKELADAAEQKKALDQTLFELGQSKKELVTVKAEKDRLEQIFNDKSKTASEKVAAFKAAVADDPVVTPTDGVTTEDLCARAKAAGASAATISALCGL